MPKFTVRMPAAELKAFRRFVVENGYKMERGVLAAIRLFQAVSPSIRAMLMKGDVKGALQRLRRSGGSTEEKLEDAMVECVEQSPPETGQRSGKRRAAGAEGDR